MSAREDGRRPDLRGTRAQPGPRALAAAVLLRALEDAAGNVTSRGSHEDPARLQADAQAFIGSRDFDFWADLAGCDGDALRERHAAGRYVMPSTSGRRFVRGGRTRGAAAGATAGSTACSTAGEA